MVKKSVAKKIKFTRHGIVRRPMGIGHNRSRKNSSLLRQKRKRLSYGTVNIKLLKNYLNAK